MPQTAVSPCVLLCRLAGRGCWTPACASRLAPDSSGPGHRWLLSRPARLSADLLGSTSGHAELQPRNAAPPGRAGLTLQHPSQVRRAFARARTHQLAARVEQNARTWPTAWTRIPVCAQTLLSLKQQLEPRHGSCCTRRTHALRRSPHPHWRLTASTCTPACTQLVPLEQLRAVQPLLAAPFSRCAHRAPLCLRAIGLSVLLLTSLSATSVQSWADSGCLANILRDVGRFASG